MDLAASWRALSLFGMTGPGSSHGATNTRKYRLRTQGRNEPGWIRRGCSMGRRTFGCVLYFGWTTLLSSAVWATTMEPGRSNFSINQGPPINSRIDANVGYSLMVRPDGAASETYGDWCEVDVQPGRVTTIAPLSTCASGPFAQGGPVLHTTPYGDLYQAQPNSVITPNEKVTPLTGGSGLYPPPTPTPTPPTPRVRVTAPQIHSVSPLK
jgi:hypothetical protein